MRFHRLVTFTAFGLLAFVRCGGGGGSSATPASAVGVTVDQPSATVTVARQRAFSASVTGTANAAVTWTVTEGVAGGSVDASGLYTAPAAPGTFHVVAASVADPARTATAAVTVIPAPAIAGFTATPGEVLPGAAVAITATFSNGTALLNPGMVPLTSGTPVTVNPTTSTVYVVSVTNAAGTTLAAGAGVTVSGQVAVGVLPSVLTVAQGTAQPLQAVVSGTTQAGVTWSVQEGAAGGMVDAAGVYTAPAHGGTYHVVATSTFDPTKQAVATLTVPRAWQPAVALSDGSVVGQYPVLRGNEAGDLLVAYYVSAGGGSLRSRSYSGATETWSAEQVLAASGTAEFTLGNLESDGSGWALYYEGGDIKARHWNGGAWGTAELVHTVVAASPYAFALASEPGGTALATWAESGVTTDILGSGRIAGTWSAAQVLDLNATFPTNPTVALRPGTGWVCFAQNDGSYNQVYSVQWTPAGFGATQKRTAVAGYPQVVSGPVMGMKDDGTVYLLWQGIATFNSPNEIMGNIYTGTWTGPFAQEAAGGAVQWSVVATRGARVTRIWAHAEGTGFTFMADRVSASPFVAPTLSGGVFVADQATTGQTLVTWMEDGYGEIPNRLAAASYDGATGTWGDRQVVATFTSGYFSLSAAVAGDGRAASAWSSIPTGGSSAQVQVRHYR